MHYNALCVFDDGRFAVIVPTGPDEPCDVFICDPAHQDCKEVELIKLDAVIDCVAIDDRRICLAGWDGIEIYDLATEESKFIPSVPAQDFGANDERFLVTIGEYDHRGQRIIVYDWEKDIFIPDLTETEVNHIGRVVLLDGKLAVCASEDSSNRNIGLWDIKKGTETLLSGHDCGVVDIVGLPGKRLVSCDVEHNVKIWKLSGSRDPLDFEGIKAKHISSIFAGQLCLLDPEDNLHIFNGDLTHNRTLENIPAENCKIIGLHDGRIALISSNQLYLSTSSGNPFQEYEPFEEEIEPALLPTGRLALCGGFYRIWVLDPLSDEFVQLIFPSLGKRCINELPDGTLITGGQDRTIKIWDSEGTECSCVGFTETDVIGLFYSRVKRSIVAATKAGFEYFKYTLIQ